jgi:SAM-dependent methyltransferase
MIEYYARRAGEYEQVYAKPERQDDLAVLRQECRGLFAGRDLLEISCGTAWWTECFAHTARRITATDINPEVLEIARAKDWDPAKIDFLTADSMALPDFGRSFDAAFAGFWWSHVPLGRLHGFLEGFHSRLAAGARVVFIDNRFVEGSSTPLSRRDEEGNTWQQRTLANGSIFEVMKNFPAEDEIRAALAPFSDEIEIRSRNYFWMAIYRLRDKQRGRGQVPAPRPET